MPVNLSYLAPPVLGAFIGYMTNHIAIRMLFRPLRPWKILGMRIPMTPGVIPSKRHDLAINIGEMVGGHLLTSQDVQRALTEQGFQQELDELINERTTALLHKELGPLPSIVPERFRSYFEAGIKILRWRSLKHIHTYLDSDAFDASIRKTVIENLHHFLQQDLKSVLPKDNRESLITFLSSTSSRFISSPVAESWLKNQLKNKFDTVISSRQSAGDILPDDLIEIIIQAIENESPALLEKLAEKLKEPSVRDRIAVTIAKGVTNFTSSLGPMAALIGNFITAETITDKVKAYLSDKGDEISAWLVDEEVRQEISSALCERVRAMFALPLAELLKKVPPAKYESVPDWLALQIIRFLQKEETRKTIKTLYQSGMEAQNNKTAAELIASVFGSDGAENGMNWAADEIVAILRSAQTKKMIDSMIVELVEKKLLNHPIGTLTALLPKEVQNSMGDFLLQQVSDLLIREVPGLVDSLNIRQLVAKKVNSLDLLKLENLLMGIMREQFKYINLFGALLGFIIGLVNLFFITS